MQIEPLILSYILGALIALALIWIVRLEIKITKLTRGQSGKNLEEIIGHTNNAQKALETWRRDVENYLSYVEKRLKRSIQATSVKRFNPFQGSGEGGNQSFAVTLIDESGNGIVLSSLHTRERVSVYAKPIENHSSGYEPTTEEKETIDSARRQISNS